MSFGLQMSLIGFGTLFIIFSVFGGYYAWTGKILFFGKNKQDSTPEDLIPEEIKDCANPNNSNINLCTDDYSLTETDKAIREKIFNDFILPSKPFEMDDGRIGREIPFESIIFLTKDYNPLVSPYGDIEISIKEEKLLRALVIGDRITKSKAKEELQDILGKDSKLIEHVENISEQKESKSKNAETILTEEANVDENLNIHNLIKEEITPSEAEILRAEIEKLKSENNKLKKIVFEDEDNEDEEMAITSEDIMNETPEPT